MIHPYYHLKAKMLFLAVFFQHADCIYIASIPGNNKDEPEMSPAADIANNNIAMLETGVETWYANTNTTSSINNNGTSRTIKTHFKQWPAGHIVQNTDCVGKKTELRQRPNGGLNGSITTSITTSDINRVMGCHSSCRYRHERGLLVLVAFVTDG